MSYLSNVLARAVSVAAVAAFAVLVALVALIRCWPGCASCNCPGGGGGSTTVTDGPPVLSDRGRRDQRSGVYRGGRRYRFGLHQSHERGGLQRPGAAENGDTYGLSITVQLENIQGACDCSRLIISNQSGPTLVSTGDGGTD